MVRIEAVVVQVELVEDHVTWGAHLQAEVDSDILVTEVAGNQKMTRLASQIWGISGLTMQHRLVNDRLDLSR